MGRVAVFVGAGASIAHQAIREALDWSNSCECGHGPLRMVLVAPSLIRDVWDVNLLEVWKAALEYMRLADEWVVIGYSFPSEDIAIRSLFLRAYQGRGGNKPPTVRVIQDTEHADITARYKVLFPECTFEYGGTEAFVDGLASPPQAPG